MPDPSPENRPGQSNVPPALAVGRQAPDRNLAMELVRVTEAGALAAGRWVGRGDKNGGGGAAGDALRALIRTLSKRGGGGIGGGGEEEGPALLNRREGGGGHGPGGGLA